MDDVNNSRDLCGEPRFTWKFVLYNISIVYSPIVLRNFLNTMLRLDAYSDQSYISRHILRFYRPCFG